MRLRTPQIEVGRRAAVTAGAVMAAVVGLACGAALRPTEAEAGLPRPPQLIYLSDGELAVFEGMPRRVWPSVPAAWRS